MKTDNPVIRQSGFDVVGTDYGGWIVIRSRRFNEDTYMADPFIAAFSTFDEMLTWLGSQTRHDNTPSEASDTKPTPD